MFPLKKKIVLYAELDARCFSCLSHLNLTEVGKVGSYYPALLGKQHSGGVKSTGPWSLLPGSESRLCH